MPELGETGREAKDVCAICPVRGECLQLALENKEQYGIWGGRSLKERRKLFKPYQKLAKEKIAARSHPTAKDVLYLETLYTTQ